MAREVWISGKIPHRFVTVLEESEFYQLYICLVLSPVSAELHFSLTCHGCVVMLQGHKQSYQEMRSTGQWSATGCAGGQARKTGLQGLDFGGKGWQSS
jgi:hypothetical protein